MASSLANSITPGAPWRIRSPMICARAIAEDAPDGYLTVYQTMRLLGVSRQTVWQRVKRGEIDAIHVKQGRKKGLRLKPLTSQPSDLQTSWHRRWKVASRAHPVPKLVEIILQVGFELLDRLPVHTG